MTAELISAFTPSTMSAGLLEEIFVKREPLADEILTSIAEAVLQPPGRRDLEHHLVVGPRGIGKTHLLTIVANRLVARPDLAGRVVVARLREEEWGVSTAGELLEQVVRHLAADDQPDESVRTAAASEVAGLASMPIDALEDAAAKAIAHAAADRLVVIAVENVDELFDSLGTDEEHALRARLQNDRNLVLLASTPSLGSSISSRSGLWFGFFDIERLDELDVEEARDLLLRLARLGPGHGDAELIEFLESDVATDRLRVVQQVVGGHPRLWMLMADCITTQRLDEVVGLIVAVLDDLTPYYQSQMKLLTGQQRKIVVELTRRPGAVTVGDLARATRIGERVAAKQLGDLGKLGYVRLAELPDGVEVADKRQRRYELREPLLRHSLEHKESRGRPLSLIVEFLRAWFDRSRLEEWARATPGPAAAHARAALDSLGLAAGRQPDSSQQSEALASFNHGVALSLLGRHEDALAEFDAALRLAPGLARAHHNRGTVLAKLGRPEEALEAVDRSIEFDATSPRAYANRGAVLATLQRWDESLAASDTAIRLDPSLAHAQRNRGIALEELGRPEEAMLAYEAAIAIDPDSRAQWNRVQSTAWRHRPLDVGHVVAAMAFKGWSPSDSHELRVSIGATQRVPADARPAWVGTWVDAAVAAGRVDELLAAIVPSLREHDREWWKLWANALLVARVEAPLVDLFQAVNAYLVDLDGSVFLSLPVELRDVAYELAGFNRPERKLRLRADP